MAQPLVHEGEDLPVGGAGFSREALGPPKAREGLGEAAGHGVGNPRVQEDPALEDGILQFHGSLHGRSVDFQGTVQVALPPLDVGQAHEGDDGLLAGRGDVLEDLPAQGLGLVEAPQVLGRFGQVKEGAAVGRVVSGGGPGSLLEEEVRKML